MTVISREKCTEKLILALLPEQSTFCAEAKENSFACPGDSGGGIIDMVNGKFYLRGIASVTLTHANGRCDVENPVGFTDTQAFSRWITENINSNADTVARSYEQLRQFK
jgi:secreted trypsin-like serine protease